MAQRVSLPNGTEIPSEKWNHVEVMLKFRCICRRRNGGLVLRLGLDGDRGLGGELALGTLTLRSEATNCTLIPRPKPHGAMELFQVFSAGLKGIEDGANLSCQFLYSI